MFDGFAEVGHGEVGPAADVKVVAVELEQPG
jgi:hypothetical protein